MGDAKRDQNFVTTLLAVSNADGVTPVVLWADPTTHRLLVDLAGGLTIGGTDTQVQFNDSGALGGDAGFTYNKTTNTATLDVIQLTNSGLKVLDTDASHYLIITPGSNLTANRVLTLVTGDAARSLTLTGDLAMSGAFNLTFTVTGNTNVTLPTTGTLATLAGSEALTNKSINGLTVTASTGVLTIANGATLSVPSSATVSGTNTGDQTSIVGITGTIAQFNTAVTDADFATLAGTEELDNKTLDSSVLKGTFTASGTVTMPAFTMGGDVTFGENTALVMDAALSADGKYCGLVRAGTAGATLAFGDLIYLAAADSRWELADADAASTSGDVILGICVLAAAADGNATTIMFYGLIRADAVFPAMTIGAPMYVGTTAGDIQTAQPSGTDDVIRRVGFAWTADELLFNPSNDYITHT